MGINISVQKLIGKEMVECHHPEELVPFYKIERQDWFDSCRHSGDRDFIMNNDFKYLDEDVDSFEQSLMRPVDLDAALEWVRKNIYEGNQARLIEVLEKM